MIYSTPLIQDSKRVSPETTEEVAEILARADAEGSKVVPHGAGTKLDRGTPPERCDLLLDLSRMNRIVEHSAGDLVVTVEAGVRLDTLQSVLAEAGQWLAIDPPFPGTVGGLISVGDSGPRRLRYGGVRDLILGVKFVRADGTIARGGGKVVKNVAGYDMPKLLTGALGTLGVIVEATFRLYPVQPASATVVARGLTPSAAWKRSDLLLQSTLVPTSIDYASGAGFDSALAVRFESTPTSVEVQAHSAATSIQGEPLIGDAEKAYWSGLDTITDTGEHDVLAHLVCVPSDLATVIEAAQQGAANVGVETSVRAHMGHGHALLRLQPADADEYELARLLKSVRQEAEKCGGNLVIWRASDNVRASIDVWGDVGDSLSVMRRIKAQFDPNRTLNPGRFVAGI